MRRFRIGNETIKETHKRTIGKKLPIKKQPASLRRKKLVLAASDLASELALNERKFDPKEKQSAKRLIKQFFIISESEKTREKQREIEDISIKLETMLNGDYDYVIGLVRLNFEPILKRLVDYEKANF